MVERKHRCLVVLDTNVLVRALKTRSLASPNQRILRLWLIERKLQLVVSNDLVNEYIGVFAEILKMSELALGRWRKRWLADSRTTVVNLGKRHRASRDPDDNLLLDTASAGQVAYLVTNDRDLLDLPVEFAKTLTFKVLPPSALLRELDSQA